MAAFAPQTRGEKEDKFLLLLRRKAVGGNFDFGERAHAGVVYHSVVKVQDNPCGTDALVASEIGVRGKWDMRGKWDRHEWHELKRILGGDHRI